MGLFPQLVTMRYIGTSSGNRSDPGKRQSNL
jgi:hypothetical protein